ncbi:hypothetical protein RUM44_012859 [Polyplax serrata]|uniref:Histone-lysine N-methyltransferase trithorax n=1 Tax=Polyplax serrata TaxID=468196 RepID=A0ABR1BGU9_POLSC
MAADRPLVERGFVEIKMGRSKFPGKPSKIGNRKRVNLSSCSLPEENDSSKAAKNIYLGLSVFNEIFGDNEMVAPGPFHGFCMTEVEEALAEARLQQKQSEVEHKKQGININLWNEFQNELFSITSCSKYNNTSTSKSGEINKTNLSFDGGGFSKATDSTSKSCDNIINWPSRKLLYKSIEKCQINGPQIRKMKNRKVVKFQPSQLKFNKLQCSPHLKKSLQSQAAKKLLEKAKMSNISECNKNTFADKKLSVSKCSIRSSRIINANKRFKEDNTYRSKFLRSTAKLCNYTNTECTQKDTLSANASKNGSLKLKIEQENCFKKRGVKNEGSLSSKQNISENLKESIRNRSLEYSGKVILREARLQLDKNNMSLLEGPFSTPNLSPNSQLTVNTKQSVTFPGSIVCGVCGIVRFYKFVEQAKKFGIYCCEFCQEFISKIIKSFDIKQHSKLQCLKGNGLCGVNTVIKSYHFNINGPQYQSVCQACWLKLCLKNFNMPHELKEKLLKLLPVNIQMAINVEFSTSKEVTHKFVLDSNIKDFKWLNENSSICSEKLNWPGIPDANHTEKYPRKRKRKTEKAASFLAQSGKVKADADEKSRQISVLKGPRVKHVCRSASVVLGQPLAVFPSDTSPNKKEVNVTVEDCNNCDNAVTKITNAEPQGIPPKPAFTESTDAKQKKEKKVDSVKEIINSKIGKLQMGGAKSKKRDKSKMENPVSMEFWESYDPEEICETGFGLIGSEMFSVRALCFLCGSSGQENLIHCGSCCEPYHEFCVEENQLKLHDGSWKFDWICPRCRICATCGKTSGQQLICVKCENSYHTECVDRVGGRLLHSPDRPWVCSACLRCKSCNGIDVSVFVGNLPLCKSCFVLRQKGNYCPLCQRCYEDDDYDSKMMECGQCKCWVHAKCEGLSDEKYEVLSFLPESVEYVCRMCCVIPPAPWWLAVEAELKSGYLGVLKALSKNRKACTMLKWSPRKQCTCRQLGFVSRALDFGDTKCSKVTGSDIKNVDENKTIQIREEKKCDVDKVTCQPGTISGRKTSIEVINHPTESLKLTLKIMKGFDADVKDKTDASDIVKDEQECETNIDSKENKVRVKKCPSTDENSEDSMTSAFDHPEENHLNSMCKRLALGVHSSDLPEKRSISSPLNPSSDSGIGITDDELKASHLTDEDSCKLDDQPSSEMVEVKQNCDTSVSFLEEKRECFCFLEVDSYNSRSKPFSPNLMSIKKKVTTSEYSSVHQFHQDMERMITTTHSTELMELYHQTIKDIFPWFDPKFSRVQNSSQKVVGTMSLESTPVKNTPLKNTEREECKIPKEELCGRSVDYYYSNYTLEDTRICLLCKTLGDGPPGDTGRLLYCGQNEWVHCNCALWSGEVFEEIDGSLQNVQSAISRGRSIRCPVCSLKGASIGCCARNCQETFHFGCARKIGCNFMDDKTMYCLAHKRESIGKVVQNEKDFEIRRPVYVELDKRKMKSADSNDIRFAVGALQVNSLGKFIVKLSDQEEAIVPDQYSCTRWFWSCYEPWRIVRYHFSVRVDEGCVNEGVDFGVNITIDHSLEPDVLQSKLKQLSYFQSYNTLMDTSDKFSVETPKVKLESSRIKSFEDQDTKLSIAKKSRKGKQVVRKIFEQFDSKDDENCLADNQNTAALLPPDIEEAIFRDLPHDILDGISMQDIFMDIKNDPFESGSKDDAIEDSCECDSNIENSSREKKNECNNQNAFWIEGDNRQVVADESGAVTKSTKDFKRSKLDTQSTQPVKKPVTLKTYQKSSGLKWNYKTDVCNNKWKKSSKCQVSVNLLEPQERATSMKQNMLQELKFTDGLVTGVIGSMKDLKSRLDDNKRSIQDEGKENKFLSWQARLQPRLLQVDGNVDSSSGSEAGESPQRMMEESTSSHRDTRGEFSLPCSKYSGHDKVPFPATLTDGVSLKDCDSANCLPQLYGNGDGDSDTSDSDDSDDIEMNLALKKRRLDSAKLRKSWLPFAQFKINQCDGGVDSEYEEEDLVKCALGDELPCSVATSKADEEPVKCSKCHCTYRTKISYQRHLESCTSDFILSSSEAEISDEESPKKNINSPQTPMPEVSCSTKNDQNVVKKGENESSCKSTPVRNAICNTSPATNSVTTEKASVKREKVVRKSYTRKRPTQNVKKTPTTNTMQQVKQILVQQQNAAPAVIVQDLGLSNMVPTPYPGSTVGFVAAIDSQNPFVKPQLIAAPGSIISGNFQFSSTPETQLLCLNSQSMQTANVPGFIIQQPNTGALIPSQPAPVVMSGDQMILGSNGLYDPCRGGMFLTSYNQPVLYNMETIVSNTVINQTNQFVSNVLGTTQSYSQTSTQIFQASEMEQIVSLPSNYFVVRSSPPSTDELICIQTPQAYVPTQNSIQVTNQSGFTSVQPIQAFSAEPKIMPTQINSVRCLQPVGPSLILSKIPNANGTGINQPVTQLVQKPTQPLSPAHPRSQVKIAPPPSKKIPPTNQGKSIVTPKTSPKSNKSPAVQIPSRALVDYINNFKSDTCDTITSIKPSVVECEVQVPVSVSSTPESNNKSSKPTTNTSEDTSNILQPENYVEPTLPDVIPISSPVSSKDYPTDESSESTPQILPIPAPEESIEGTQMSLPTMKSVVQPDTSRMTSPVVKCSTIVKGNNSPTLDNQSNVSNSKCNDVQSTQPEDNTTQCKSTSSDTAKTELISDSFKESSSNEVLNEKNTFSEKYLSMPSLDDDLPIKTTLEKSDCTDTLPLQENIPTVTSNLKKKSLKELSACTNRIWRSNSQAKGKCKRKMICNDQNIFNSSQVLDKTNPLPERKEFENPKPVQQLSFGKSYEERGPKLVFDVVSEDGYSNTSSSMAELWANICDSVQEMRASVKIPLLPSPRKGYEILGMQNHGLQHCLEQLRGVEQCLKYKCKYFLKDPSQKEDEEDEVKENLSGCARTEQFRRRKEYDMFAWLASKHRELPKLMESGEESLSSIRRANNLPLAMKYRNLRETAKMYLGVYRSKIHGRGLFCLREIEAGEMVIEYAGEVIRSTLTDKREKYYTDKGIGCYMFRIDDHFVVDATMKGNAARFINHSCEPNCYSKVVDILGKKHIVIFALRKIAVMEELTYDYKFPFEDEKISCHCLSKKCKKYLN